VRREEQRGLFERLNRKRSHSGGTSFSVKECMRLLIEFYGGDNLYDGEKQYKWKLSLDGRTIGGQQQVMMGITPFDFGLAVQFCYSTFLVAIVCGLEDSKFLLSEWKELFQEINEMKGVGFLVR
jgi:hypothetical protein